MIPSVILIPPFHMVNQCNLPIFTISLLLPNPGLLTTLCLLNNLLLAPPRTYGEGE